MSSQRFISNNFENIRLKIKAENLNSEQRKLSEINKSISPEKKNKKMGSSSISAAPQVS